MSARASEVLPAAGRIVEAFGSTGSAVAARQLVLVNARALVGRHQCQWDAEDRCRSASASVAEVAVAKGMIDRLNARRVVLVEEIDLWVSETIAGSAGGALHTETLGSVVDRLAIAWVRASRLDQGSASAGLAELARRQL